MQTIFAQEVVKVSNSRGYLLGPGDEIVTKVLGEPQFDFEAAVDENGNIEVPFLDKPISAMCKSERELKTEVTTALSKYLRNPQISLRTKERKSRPPTTIYGAVRSPQQVILMRNYRLSEIIAVAGGKTEEAGGTIQIVRQQPPLCGTAEEISDWKAQTTDVNAFPIKIYSLSSIETGAIESNPLVYPGDIVKVEAAKPVYLVGEVKGGQGGVYIKERGLRLGELIAQAGGVNREAKTKDIKIYRLRSNSTERDVISANYDLIKTGKQADITLEPYDIIEVDKAKKSIGQIILDLAVGGAKTAFSTFATGAPTRILY